MKIVDLTGKKIGRWTVISRAARDKKWHHSRWLCKCGCGTHKEVNAHALLSGDSNGCRTCHGKSLRLPGNNGAKNRTFRLKKANAVSRGLSWEISKERFMEVTQQVCFYCGASPFQMVKKSTHGVLYENNYKYNGLDRIDNSKGYTEDNVVSCCGQCNLAKNNKNLDEFAIWIEKIYKNFVINGGS